MEIAHTIIKILGLPLWVVEAALAEDEAEVPPAVRNAVESQLPDLPVAEDLAHAMFQFRVNSPETRHLVRLTRDLIATTRRPVSELFGADIRVREALQEARQQR